MLCVLTPLNTNLQKQRSVKMTEKELELRNKIKQHASRLKEYHFSDKKKRSEAQLHLEEVIQ